MPFRSFDSFESLSRRGRQSDTFSVPLKNDEKGYLDRECPSKPCLFKFKVHGDDWEKRVKKNAFCPCCRHEAAKDQWHTTEQVEHAKREALNHLKGLVHGMLESVARDFNRNQPRGGFLTVSMQVSGRSHRTFTIPAPAAKALTMEITCEQCQSKFAVLGSAFFCPTCGHSSAERVFDDAIEKVRAKVDLLSEIKKPLEAKGHKDQAAVICRSLLESSIMECVSALQRFSEQVYERTQPARSAPFNAFQRIDQSSDLWRAALGEGHENWLTPHELARLKLHYQRRHKLAHAEGIVDVKYVRESGDPTYTVGQRIVVSDDDVLELAGLVAKIAAGLRRLVNR